MSVIDRVKSHFETLKTKTIEVDKKNEAYSMFYVEPQR